MFYRRTKCQQSATVATQIKFLKKKEGYSRTVCERGARIDVVKVIVSDFNFEIRAGNMFIRSRNVLCWMALYFMPSG